MARPGNRCPPVPPPAITTRTPAAERGRGFSLMRLLPLCEVMRGDGFASMKQAAPRSILLFFSIGAGSRREMLSSTPMAPRSMTSVEPPNDKNGSVKPLGRQRSEDDADVERRLQSKHRGNSHGQIHPKRIAGPRCRRTAAQNQDHVQSDDEGDADKTQLLADDRQDVGRCGLRAKQQFCRLSPNPWPVSPPEPTAISDAAI